MPQANNNGCKLAKKKKGRAPAHQNQFAFKHNPKSKKTDAILNSPNTHTCRRCHDKIDWRKKYRKYKPRTQPGKCNICLKRNVMAAYHTICTECTTSEQAFSNLSILDSNADVVEEAMDQNPSVNDDMVDQVSLSTAKLTVGEITDASISTTSSMNGSTSKKRPCHRVCAMCVKEPALPDEDNEQDASIDTIAAGRKLKLRERRALERKIAKQEQEDAVQSKCQANGNAAQEDEHQENVVLQDENNEMSDDELVLENGSDTEEDDLIKAVGGQDKLLTGEAYQKMLLEREQGRQD